MWRKIKLAHFLHYSLYHELPEAEIHFMLKHGPHPEPGLLSPYDLFQENRQLRQQLDDFVHLAKRNERKLKRVQTQELRLISSRSLQELVSNLLMRYRESSRLEWVTLTLIDPEYEIQRLLGGVFDTDNPWAKLIFHLDDRVLRPLYHGGRKPLLGAFDETLHGPMFPNSKLRPHSVALLPLYEHNRLIGSINLGSRHEQRFQQSDGTDFLERLAAIFPLCLENSLNQDRLKKVGLTDPLTGINNRRFFDQRLMEEVLRCQREQTPLVCLFLDVDHFKNINDNYGHPVGDQVLAQLAVLIRNQLRVTDVLARYGGEEFSALLHNTEINEALEIAERIRQTVDQYQFLLPDKDSLHITLSIGIAAYHGTQQCTVDMAGHDLVNNADAALYQAKDSGRNCIIVNT